MTPGLRTVLIGLGRVGAGYAADAVMARHYPYATHAQVLAAHPAFAWEAVVDQSPEALENARRTWRIVHVARSAAALAARYEPEVAVIATPPEARLEMLDQLPSLRAVVVEKPLGLTVPEARRFLARCRKRSILVQVNLWRRADEGFQALRSGRLSELVGRPQAVFGLYGNGLLNNGTHVIDLVRLLLGEIDAVRALGAPRPRPSFPIRGDADVAFALMLHSGVVVAVEPVDFEHYREVGLDIWGERGRLAVMNEGLSVLHYPRCENRAVQAAREIAADRPNRLEPTVGHALYRLYDNLAAAVRDGVPLWSPGRSALETARVIEAIVDSSARRGAMIKIRRSRLQVAELQDTVDETTRTASGLR